MRCPELGESTVLSVNIWMEMEMELEPEPKLWTKAEPKPVSEPKINNFGSATLLLLPSGEPDNSMTIILIDFF